jgi:hypothetical protein
VQKPDRFEGGDSRVGFSANLKGQRICRERMRVFIRISASAARCARWVA